MMTEIIYFTIGMVVGWALLGIGIYLYARHFKSQVFKAFKKNGFDTSKLEIHMKPDNPEDEYKSEIKEEEKIPVEVHGIKCPKCEKEFKTKANLTMHLRFKHKEDKSE
jgi:hypothetical protein